MAEIESRIARDTTREAHRLPGSTPREACHERGLTSETTGSLTRGECRRQSTCFHMLAVLRARATHSTTELCIEPGLHAETKHTPPRTAPQREVDRSAHMWVNTGLQPCGSGLAKNLGSGALRPTVGNTEGQRTLTSGNSPMHMGQNSEF